MDTFYVYILHSQTLNKFYTGHSQYLGKRRRQHRARSSHWTSQASDWTEVWHIQVESRDDAARLEKKIKHRGAKRFLADRGQEDLTPELS